MPRKFTNPSELGITEDGNKTPMHAIKITPDFYPLIEGRVPVIYETDGHKIFNLMNKSGMEEGKIIYVMFLTEEEYLARYGN